MSNYTGKMQLKDNAIEGITGLQWGADDLFSGIKRCIGWCNQWCNIYILANHGFVEIIDMGAGTYGDAYFIATDKLFENSTKISDCS